MADRPAEERAPAEQPLRDEMTMAREWLSALRENVVYKVEGLTADQLRWRPTPTANSIGMLVRHLGLAERLWFRAICAGEPMDMAWRATMFDDFPADWDVSDLVAFYETEVAAADAALDTAASFDEPSRATFRPTTWRWAVVHMIEEIARHLGHMDITRELIDGQTGR
jgi:hypothetical protein